MVKEAGEELGVIEEEVDTLEVEVETEETKPAEQELEKDGGEEDVSDDANGRRRR